MGEKRLMAFDFDQAWDSKNTQFCPSEATTARLQASLSSPQMERNHARSAFHTVFSIPHLIRFEHLQSYLENKRDKKKVKRMLWDHDGDRMKKGQIFYSFYFKRKF
jgi:hypothetical protein